MDLTAWKAHPNDTSSANHSFIPAYSEEGKKVRRNFLEQGGFDKETHLRLPHISCVRLGFSLLRAACSQAVSLTGPPWPADGCISRYSQGEGCVRATCRQSVQTFWILRDESLLLLFLLLPGTNVPLGLEREYADSLVMKLCPLQSSCP